jgi:hypothetical protein
MEKMCGCRCCGVAAREEEEAADVEVDMEESEPLHNAKRISW